MPPTGYKRKSTGSLPKTTTAAKSKRLSELEISPLVESRSTGKALTTSKKQAPPVAKVRPSPPFNSFSSVSFSPAVVKRRPVYSNALKEKTSNFDRSSSVISKLTGQTYGYEKKEKTTTLEILEKKTTKTTAKGKSSAKKDAAQRCSPTEPAKNATYTTKNLFTNDIDLSMEYPATNSGKSDKSRNYSKTAKIVQSLNDHQIKSENKKQISNRKSEAMFDSLKMINESAEMPTSQFKDVLMKVQDVAKPRQNKPPEKLEARVREQEVIFREPKKAPVRTLKIEKPTKKNLVMSAKTTSGVASDHLVQKFRDEMKSLLSNFYKSCMNNVETRKLTLQDRTEEQIGTCGATKVDSKKINVEKQTLWLKFESDLIPMLSDVNGELNNIVTCESRVQETLKSHFESIRKTRECIQSQVDNILNRMTIYGNRIQECLLLDHNEKKTVNNDENSDIVDLNQQENKTDEGIDSAHDSLSGLFD